MDLSLGYTRMLIDAAKARGLLRNQTAYLLATSFWETAHTMKPVVEAYWLSENWRRTHLKYYPWFGRGFVQLTWEANYLRAERELGIAFTKDPSLALDPTNAANIAVLGMSEGWFTRHKLADYIDLQHSDFFHARQIINGMDKANEIAVLAQHYDEDLKAEWVG
jgi:predicted chitinase